QGRRKARDGLRLSLKKCEDLGALFRAEVRLLLRLHLVEHSRPVVTLARLVHPVAGGALRPVDPLVIRQGPRRARCASRRQQQSRRKSHRFIPSTERTKVPVSDSSPKPAPTCSQKRLL